MESGTSQLNSLNWVLTMACFSRSSSYAGIASRVCLFQLGMGTITSFKLSVSWNVLDSMRQLIVLSFFVSKIKSLPIRMEPDLRPFPYCPIMLLSPDFLQEEPNLMTEAISSGSMPSPSSRKQSMLPPRRSSRGTVKILTLVAAASRELSNSSASAPNRNSWVVLRD